MQPRQASRPLPARPQSARRGPPKNPVKQAAKSKGAVKGALPPGSKQRRDREHANKPADDATGRVDGDGAAAHANLIGEGQIFAIPVCDT